VLLTTLVTTCRLEQVEVESSNHIRPMSYQAIAMDLKESATLEVW